MPSRGEDVQALVENPQERLAVELKDWIDPATPEGQSKIIRACIAMRNNNGGYLLVGFTDQPGVLNIAGAPPNVRSTFHADEIQSLVTKYASESFEVYVHFPQRDGQEFPVIEVDPGVTTPVATKRTLAGADRKRNLINKDDIYVRSLDSNNTASTTKAKYQDWPRLIESCFNNREADIGRFLRRHAPAFSQELAQALGGAQVAQGEPASSPEIPSVEEQARAFREEGFLRLRDALEN